MRNEVELTLARTDGDTKKVSWPVHKKGILVKVSLIFLVTTLWHYFKPTDNSITKASHPRATLKVTDLKPGHDQALSHK